ncbi:MAG: putative lipid II flippase FtsW [Actinobacteria bacterium]|nr:putative lipid II flippase FtsW [Actinomycetota bacterium]
MRAVSKQGRGKEKGKGKVLVSSHPRLNVLQLDRVDAAAADTLSSRRPNGRRTGTYLALAALLLLLNLTGLVMVLSASGVSSLDDTGSPWSQFTRQALWLGLGTIALLVVVRIDYRRWRKVTGPLLLLSMGLLALVLVPGLGVEVNGASRWLGFGMFRVQPSELAKLAVLLFVADLLTRRAHRIDETQLSLRPVMVVFVILAGLIMAQPNLGTTMLIFAIIFALLFVAGVPGWRLGLVLGGTAAIGALFLWLTPFRRRRLFAFTDPWADPLNTGYQPLQSQVGLANGGVYGTGLGAGRAKYGFLPEAHTDFIFTVIGEELGLVGACVVVAVFIAFGVVGARVAMKAPDRFGMLVATGITSWFLFQAFVNIGAAVGVLPITGVPLPFVSFGGSSLVVSMIAMGILLNVARHTDAAAAGDGDEPAPRRHRRAKLRSAG